MKSLLLKYIILSGLILTIIGLSVAFGQEDFEAKVKELKIKTKTETITDFDNPISANKSFVSSKEHYNEEGFLVETELFFPNNLLQKRMTFEYDDKGNRVKEFWYMSNDSTFMNLLTFEFDEDNNLVKGTKMIGDDRPMYHYELTYRDDEVVSRTTTSASGQVIQKLIYDNQDDAFYTVEFDGENNQRSKTIDLYNEKDELVKSSFFNGNGQMVESYTYTYTYNDNELLTHVKTFGSDKRIITASKFSYDKY